MRTVWTLGAASLAMSLANAWMGGPVAHAQDASGAGTEEVIVTATRREQNILQVPVAVSAYGGAQIEAAQVQTLQDLQQIAPSLVVNQSNGSSTTSFIMRGLGTSGTDVGLEQSVGVFIDGVYRGRPGAALVDLVDIERVEILRGPQGSLFGRNTTAGVIDVHTREPSFDFGARADLTLGSFESTILRASITGPIVDDVLAVSLTGGLNQRGGFTDERVSGQDVDTIDRSTVRGQALWRISPNATVRLIADYTEETGTCCTASPIFYGPAGPILASLGATLQPGAPGVAPSIPGPTQFVGTVVDPFRREVAINVLPDNSFSDGGLGATLNLDLGAMVLSATGSRRFFENDQLFDADFTDAELFTTGTDREIDETSIEIRLSSDTDKPVSWMVGASYFDQQIDSTILSTLGVDAREYFNLQISAATGGAVSLNALVPAFTALSGGQVTNANLIAAGTFQRGTFNQEGQSWSVFGRLEREGQWLTLTGDLRYLREEKEAFFAHETNDTFSQITLQSPPLPNNAALLRALGALQTFETFDDYTTGLDDEAVVGSASASFQVWDRANVYVRYAHGYKAGGVNLNFDAGGQRPGSPGLDTTGNPNGVDPDQALFEPETIDAVELGLKGVFFGGSLRASAALFAQELNDFQVNTFNGDVGAFTLTNAGQVRSQGFELDYRLRPHSRWVIEGAVLLLDAEYTDFANGPQIAVPTGVVAPQNQDLTGERPIFSPEVTLSGGVQYSQPLGAGLGLVLRTDYRYRSEYFTALDNDPISLQDANTILDVSATFEVGSGHYALQFWSKNVTDEGVKNIVFDTPLQNGNYNAFLEAPRTYGVTGRVRF